MIVSNIMFDPIAFPHVGKVQKEKRLKHDIFHKIHIAPSFADIFSQLYRGPTEKPLQGARLLSDNSLGNTLKS